MYYTQRGTVPPKPFTVMCGPGGEPTHEELFTSDGFRGPASILYHLRPPTAVESVEELSEFDLSQLEGSDLRNHQVDMAALGRSGAWSMARTPIYFNDDLTYWLCTPSEVVDSFYRNAYSDELVLVVSGTGRLRTAFGSLDYGPLDFMYIPRGVAVRLEGFSGPVVAAVMEMSSPVGPPPRYVNPCGQLSYRGLYQERDIRVPVFGEPSDTVGDHAIDVKIGTRLVRHTVGSHPFDVVGWDGALYPYAVNMRSFAPMSGRLHTIPDIYEVFESRGVFINAITPVRQPDHEDSTSAQPDHTSDCDEVFHRFGTPDGDGFNPGVITLHTRAAAHGPSPALKARPRRERTTGWGVLIDTVRPTKMARAAADGDVRGYHGEAR